MFEACKGEKKCFQGFLYIHIALKPQSESLEPWFPNGATLRLSKKLKKTCVELGARL